MCHGVAKKEKKSNAKAEKDEKKKENSKRTINRIGRNNWFDDRTKSEHINNYIKCEGSKHLNEKTGGKKIHHTNTSKIRGAIGLYSYQQKQTSEQEIPLEIRTVPNDKRVIFPKSLNNPMGPCPAKSPGTHKANPKPGRKAEHTAKLEHRHASRNNQ